MNTKSTITFDKQEQPNLRKLARALINLARQELAADGAAEANATPNAEAVKPAEGDAA